MIKKTKIPKYKNGTPGVETGEQKYKNPWSQMTFDERLGSGINVATTAANLAFQSAGKSVTAKDVVMGGLSGAATGAAIGGVPGAIIGGAGGMLLSSIGTGGSVNEVTGEITNPSGIAGIFGHSKSYLQNKSNRIKTSLADQQLTQDLNYNFYSDPNNSMNGSIFATAAEGGIMRRPVDALVSKGELIYNPVTKKLSKVPGSKGKPNKEDNVYAKLAEGDVVISNSPTMLMSNGKTPAQNLEGLVDSNKNTKAKEAIIKKVVNWQEANKTKPQEYTKFDEGYPGFFKYLMNNRTRPLDAVMSEWFKQRGEAAPKLDGFGKLDFLNGIKNIYNSQSDYEAPIKLIDDFNWNQHRSVPIYKLFEFNPNALTTKVEKPKNTSTRSTTKVNHSSQNAGIHTNSEIDPVWSRHKTSDFVATETVTPVLDIPTVSEKKLKTTVSKKGEVSKPSSGKNTTVSQVTTSTTPSPEDTVIRRPERVYDYEEPAKAIDTPVDDTKVYGREGDVRYDYLAPERKVNPAELGRSVDKGINRNGSDWRDNLYRMAVLSQPLWGREKAEPVDYNSPVYKYMPTTIDVSSQLESADQNYALSRYNFANLYPNTGAGMAASLQAASNRAKQYADIRQWQTNAQNELIGKNTGIYNNWSNEHARILNDVRNKYAQNRATARNINRQNMSAMLGNFGTMLRDDKQFAMDNMKLQMIEPMMQYGYENYEDYLNWKKTNGYG